MEKAEVLQDIQTMYVGDDTGLLKKVKMSITVEEDIIA